MVVWFKDLLGSLTRQGPSIWVSRFYISNKALIAKVTDHLIKPGNKSVLSVGQEWTEKTARMRRNIQIQPANNVIYSYFYPNFFMRATHCMAVDLSSGSLPQKFYLVYVNFGNAQLAAKILILLRVWSRRHSKPEVPCHVPSLL